MSPSLAYLAQVWDVVEHGDFGCTRGGGRDAKGVFTDAGLLFASSTGVKTQIRQGQNHFSCCNIAAKISNEKFKDVF